LKALREAFDARHPSNFDPLREIFAALFEIRRMRIVPFEIESLSKALRYIRDGVHIDTPLRADSIAAPLLDSEKKYRAAIETLRSKCLDLVQSKKFDFQSISVELGTRDLMRNGFAKSFESFEGEAKKALDQIKSLSNLEDMKASIEIALTLVKVNTSIQREPFQMQELSNRAAKLYSMSEKLTKEAEESIKEVSKPVERCAHSLSESLKFISDPSPPTSPFDFGDMMTYLTTLFDAIEEEKITVSKKAVRAIADIPHQEVATVLKAGLTALSITENSLKMLEALRQQMAASVTKRVDPFTSSDSLERFPAFVEMKRLKDRRMEVRRNILLRQAELANFPDHESIEEGDEVMEKLSKEQTAIKAAIDDPMLSRELAALAQQAFPELYLHFPELRLEEVLHSEGKLSAQRTLQDYEPIKTFQGNKAHLVRLMRLKGSNREVVVKEYSLNEDSQCKDAFFRETRFLARMV